MSTRRTLSTITLAAAVAAPIALLAAAPATAATDADTARMLQGMVVEEKLAHDVYVTLGDVYSVRTFDRIAAAESRHQQAVRTLLSAYGISDPTAGDAVGEFDDPAVSRLYVDLVADGRASLTAAAGVGVTIEEMDIADLQNVLAANPAADISRVMNSLLRGSTQHLRAFTWLEDRVA